MKIILDISDHILERKGFTEFDIKMILASALINRVSSMGKTAQIVGLDYLDISENIAKYAPEGSYMSLEEMMKDYKGDTMFESFIETMKNDDKMENMMNI